jgi:hypothetical protein
MAWHGRGMVCVNQTRLHCVNQMGKTPTGTAMQGNGMGAAWERQGMCELALRRLLKYGTFVAIKKVSLVCNFSLCRNDAPECLEQVKAFVPE